MRSDTFKLWRKCVFYAAKMAAAVIAREVNMRTIRYQNEDWSPLLDSNGKSVNATDRIIYVREAQQKNFINIAKQARSNFRQLYLYRQIISLKNLGHMTCWVNKSRPTERLLPLQGGMLFYDVDCKGIVYLKNVLLKRHIGVKMSAKKASKPTS